jgi:hypothetical protein
LPDRVGGDLGPAVECVIGRPRESAGLAQINLPGIYSEKTESKYGTCNVAPAHVVLAFVRVLGYPPAADLRTVPSGDYPQFQENIAA